MVQMVCMNISFAYWPLFIKSIDRIEESSLDSRDYWNVCSKKRRVIDCTKINQVSSSRVCLECVDEIK